MMAEMHERGSGRISFWQMITFGCGTETDRKNNRRFTYWCIAWAVTIIGATWIVKEYETLPRTLAWLIAIAPNVLAFGALLAYLRLLRMTDELQRKIQIEGLAVGFGVGWFFAIGYLVLQSVGAPELPVTTLILVMTGGWIVGNLLAVRHYR